MFILAGDWLKTTSILPQHYLLRTYNSNSIMRDREGQTRQTNRQMERKSERGAVRKRNGKGGGSGER